MTKILRQKYLEEWYSLKVKKAVGKLDTYNKIKSNFGIENFAYRRDVTR